MTTVQPGGGPTVRRMLVGARPRRLRAEQGLSREQAAEAIRASGWKIHRLENGQVGFKDRDVVDQYLHVMDQICARSEHRDRTVEFLSAMLRED